MKNIPPYLLLLTILVSLMSCGKKAIVPNQLDNEITCGSINDVVKSVKNLKGIVRYNNLEKLYVIVVTLPNTIDSQDIGITCNLPKSLEKENKQVVFDGEYRLYSKTIAKRFAGQTYYYLKLTKILEK